MWDPALIQVAAANQLAPPRQRSLHKARGLRRRLRTERSGPMVQWPQAPLRPPQGQARRLSSLGSSLAAGERSRARCKMSALRSQARSAQLRTRHS